MQCFCPITLSKKASPYLVISSHLKLSLSRTRLIGVSLVLSYHRFYGRRNSKYTIELQLNRISIVHSKKKFRNLIIIMKIIPKRSIIIHAILYNYYIHPQGDFQRNYTELYRHFKKKKLKNKCRNIATMGMT